MRLVRLRLGRGLVARLLLQGRFGRSCWRQDWVTRIAGTDCR
jgi:hypothetical protein